MKYYHKYEYNNIRNTDQLLLRSNINYVIKRKYEYEKNVCICLIIQKTSLEYNDNGR